MTPETRLRKRMEKDSVDVSNTDESKEEEYLKKMEGSNSSRDEGTPINTKYQSNRKKKAHKKTHNKTLSRQGKNSKCLSRII